MRVKDIIDVDFQDYKKPSMFISTCRCTWKCCIEQGFDISICQNSDIAKQDDIEISCEYILNRYFSNKLTMALVFGGLEPMLQINDILDFVKEFRLVSEDDIVVYTGYYPDEILEQLLDLKQYKNIIVKFGRYIPNSKKIFDEVLGVELASNNQYAIKIS